MILIDLNGTVIGNIIQNKLDHDADQIKTVILATLRMYNKKFRGKYGQMYICCEGRSWRKDSYEYYKAARKTTRDSSDLNWDFIFNTMNELMEDIRNNFPWVVVQHPSAEADDVIGALVESTQEFGQHEDVVIVSSDKDFLQLQKYSNVSQFSVKHQKMISTSDPDKFLKDQIMSGDREDGVPNALSADNCLVDGIRQTPMKAKIKEQLLEEIDTQGQIQDETIRGYWERNQQMIDLSHTPEHIVKEIIEIKDNTKPAPKMKIMNYLVKLRSRNLLETIEDFYPHGK
jgi:5'-3' exonuclease